MTEVMYISPSFHRGLRRISKIYILKSSWFQETPQQYPIYQCYMKNSKLLKVFEGYFEKEKKKLPKFEIVALIEAALQDCK